MVRAMLVVRMIGPLKSMHSGNLAMPEGSRSWARMYLNADSEQHGAVNNQAEHLGVLAEAES